MKYLKNYNTFLLEHTIDYYNKKLTTLVGLDIPEFVTGDFYCHHNNLTSLYGSPKEVSSTFYCNDNNLISLEGAPKKVGINFYCFNNKLTSLDYLPEYIGGGVWCFDNNWKNPIPYKYMIKYHLHALKYDNDNYDYLWVYTQEQFDKFSSFEYQKEFLENDSENFIDLKPFGYANGIEELFPHLFDMDDLGLID